MPSLELGCGPTSKCADVGIDVLAGPAVDVVHDLNQFPWPLPSSAFDRILCFNVIEHLANVVRVMEEIHRVGMHRAVVEIRVPTGTSSDLFTDPTHVRGFGYRSFDYFVPTRPLAKFGYSRARFRVRQARFEVGPSRLFGAFDRAICAFANAAPDWYERRLAHIFPLSCLYFQLEVEKDQVP
jgi:SAM-dependent methyltransferase